MRQRQRISGLVLALVVAAATTAAEAQQQQQPATAPEWMTRTFQLEFPGGTLDDYVLDVKKLTPEMNVVVASEVQQLPVQAMVLTNVTAEGALSVVEDLLEPLITFAPVARTDRSSGTPVTIIRADYSYRQTAAFSLKGIPDSQDDPQLMDVLTFAIEALPEHQRRLPPELKLHPESKILVATAGPEQLRLIAQVIELSGGASRLDVGGAGGYGGGMYGGGYGGDGGYGGYGEMMGGGSYTAPE